MGLIINAFLEDYSRLYDKLINFVFLFKSNYFFYGRTDKRAKLPHSTNGYGFKGVVKGGQIVDRSLPGSKCILSLCLKLIFCGMCEEE